MWVKGAFNQEKALEGAFSIIVKIDCETDGSSAAQGKILGQASYSCYEGGLRASDLFSLIQPSVQIVRSSI